MTINTVWPVLGVGGRPGRLASADATPTSGARSRAGREWAATPLGPRNGPGFELTRSGTAAPAAHRELLSPPISRRRRGHRRLAADARDSLAFRSAPSAGVAERGCIFRTRSSRGIGSRRASAVRGALVDRAGRKGARSAGHGLTTHSHFHRNEAARRAEIAALITVHGSRPRAFAVALREGCPARVRRPAGHRDAALRVQRGGDGNAQVEGGRRRRAVCGRGTRTRPAYGGLLLTDQECVLPRAAHRDVASWPSCGRPGCHNRRRRNIDGASAAPRSQRRPYPALVVKVPLLGAAPGAPGARRLRCCTAGRDFPARAPSHALQASWRRRRRAGSPGHVLDARVAPEILLPDEASCRDRDRDCWRGRWARRAVGPRLSPAMGVRTSPTMSFSSCDGGPGSRCTLVDDARRGTARLHVPRIVRRDTSLGGRGGVGSSITGGVGGPGVQGLGSWK